MRFQFASQCRAAVSSSSHEIAGSPTWSACCEGARYCRGTVSQHSAVPVLVVRGNRKIHNVQWSSGRAGVSIEFSFGNGFLRSDVIANSLYVMVYAPDIEKAK